MPTTTNFGWTTPADTDLVKNGAAAIRTLGGGIDTSFVDLKGGTTGQVLSKATNTDLDFSWVGSGGLTLLSTTSLTGSSTEISISASTYKNLRIIIKDIYLSAQDESVWVRLNSDTGANYSNVFVECIGSSVSGGSTNGDTKFRFSANNINTNTTLSKTQGVIFIPRSNDTDIVTFYAQTSGRRAAGDGLYTSVFGRYDNSAAITSITFATLSAATFSGGIVYVYGEN